MPLGDTTKRAAFITGLSLLLGLLFDLFFYGKSLGIGFPVYMTCILAGLFAVAKRLRIELPYALIWPVAPLAFFSCMVFIRASALLTFLNVIASLLLLLLTVELLRGTVIAKLSTEEFFATPFVPLKFVAPMRMTISDLGECKTVVREQQAVISQIARGSLMAAPALFVFVILFSSADLVFQKYVIQAFDIEMPPEFVFRASIVFFAALVLTGAYSYVSTRSSSQGDAKGRKRIPFSLVEAGIFLGSISGLFLLFIAIQFTYLFGGERNVIAGASYAEYARRGFFELLAVAVIMLLILWIIDKYLVIGDARGVQLFKMLSTILTAEVLIIMVSSFMRLWLYERAYGFTTLRLYSHVFTVFLALIFVLFLMKLLRKEREELFAFRSFIAVVAFLAGMNLLNPDGFIVRRNMERFATTRQLDTAYISGMSDDAVPEILSLLSSTNPPDQSFLAQGLYNRLQFDRSVRFSHWQSFNLARRSAMKLIESRTSEIEVLRETRSPRL